jgi:hypothetical protein
VISCKCCGSKFNPTHHSQTFCSADCRRKWWRIKLRRRPQLMTCRVCASVFDRANRWNALSCSPECSRLAFLKYAREYGRRNYSYTPKQLVCGTCGSAFFKEDTGRIFYCSALCAETYDKDRRTKTKDLIAAAYGAYRKLLPQKPRNAAYERAVRYRAKDPERYARLWRLSETKRMERDPIGYKKKKKLRRDKRTLIAKAILSLTKEEADGLR